MSAWQKKKKKKSKLACFAEFKVLTLFTRYTCLHTFKYHLGLFLLLLWASLHWVALIIHRSDLFSSAQYRTSHLHRALYNFPSSLLIHPSLSVYRTTIFFSISVTKFWLPLFLWHLFLSKVFLTVCFFLLSHLPQTSFYGLRLSSWWILSSLLFFFALNISFLPIIIPSNPAVDVSKSFQGGCLCKSADQCLCVFTNAASLELK